MWDKINIIVLFVISFIVINNHVIYRFTVMMVLSRKCFRCDIANYIITFFTLLTYANYVSTMSLFVCTIESIICKLFEYLPFLCLFIIPF